MLSSYRNDKTITYIIVGHSAKIGALKAKI